MKQSAMSPRTGRIIEPDIAKGLGILSVILYNTPRLAFAYSAGQGAYAEQRSRLLGRTLSVPNGHSQPAQFIWLAQQAICQAVRRVARLVYAGHVLSPAHRDGADDRHGTGAATGSGSARLGSPLHRTDKRSDKPGALLTFRSRFAMIPR